MSDEPLSITTATPRVVSLLWALAGVAAGWVCMVAGSSWMDRQISNREVTDGPGTMMVGGMIMVLTFAIRGIIVASGWVRSRNR